MTSPPTRSGWAIEHHRGPASALHQLEWPAPLRPTVWVMEPTRPAVVLGSTQDGAAVDASRAATSGVDVVVRRSGGGAVLLQPDQVSWVDVLVPRGHPRWDDDVGRSFGWLGQVWVEALAAVGCRGVVHRGALQVTRWSRQVCFAGLGPGEVSVGGRKVVGLAQRRTRDAARIQSLVLAEWSPQPLVDLLGLGPVAGLDDVAVGVGDRLGDLEAAFLEALVGNRGDSC